MTAPLTDGFGRDFHYLRLSVEDACNFRCLYCLPDGYTNEHPEPPLSVAEIGRLTRAFAELGFWKIRLTGGEPTVRQDILEIARTVVATPGIRQVSLSTNGYRLAELAEGLKAAGLWGVNVSVDSLQPARFHELTGHDKLALVWEGVQRALALGLHTKINAVLLKDLNEGEFSDFLRLTKELPLSVRFIELMRTGDNEELFARRHLSAAGLLSALAGEGWSERARREGDGPARVFEKAGHQGSAGLIAPYAKDFCATCNRLRITSRGGLRLCLFAESDVPLRLLLQHDGQKAELQALVRQSLGKKEVSHYLPDGVIGGTKHLAMVGG